MAIDTSTSPYFDDYDANKNYTKILYKPGLALQARELNQTQSILQNQIKTLADTLFADGDSVSGLETSKATTNKNYRAVKLKPTFNNISINVNDFLGKYVTCQSSVDEYQNYQDYFANLSTQGYDITLDDITTLADYFTGQELLYTIDSINYYKLYRKPTLQELTYWINRFVFVYNKTINAAFKQEFILKVTADNFLSDSERIIDQSKVFLSGASDDSIFYLSTFVPYRLIGEVVEVYAADDPIVGDPPTIIIKTITSFSDKSFPSGDTLLFYNTQDNAINKIATNLKATTEDDVVFSLSGSLLASETLLTLESPSFDIKVGDYITHPSLFENLYITKVNSSISYTLSSLPKVDITVDRITVVRKNTVPTLRVTVGSGVYYKAGYMIRCEEQSLVPEKYNAWPFKSVGLDLVEEIITSNDDSSLLDPALETSNYLAVGADRLKLSLILNAYDIIDNKPDVSINYKELKRFFNGVEDPFETKNENTVIRKELAERTYDESGNYTVTPIKFQTLPSSPFSKYFDIKMSPINAYIGGFNVKTSAPLVIPIEKEISTETITSYNVRTSTGNYIMIEAPTKGFIDTNQLKQSNIFIELHSSYNVSAATKLGDAAVKSIEYLSGLGANTLFKLNSYVNTALEGKDLANTTHVIAVKNLYTASSITTWSDWTATYGYSESDGRAVSTALYESSSLLGTVTSTNYYGLFRAPDAEGLAYWTNRYINIYNRIITTAFKNEFINALIATPSSDTARSLLVTKDFYSAPTGSVFLAGTTASDYTSANIYFRANVASSGLANNKIIVFDVDPFDTQIYNTKQTNTKNIENINYEAIRVIKGATFSSGIYSKTFGGASAESFPFGDGNVPRTAAASKVQILVVSGNTANTALGIFDFTNKGNVSVSGSSKTMSIDLGDTGFNGKADIMFAVDVENISPRTKTKVSSNVAIVTIADNQTSYSLLKADIISFKGIYKIGANTWSGDYNVANTYYTGNVVVKEGSVYVANTSSTGRAVSDERYWNRIQAENTLLYYFDNGQRDTYYDHGSVKYIGDPNKIPGRCLVIFDYFTHSGEGPITADSYPSLFNIQPYRSVLTSRYYDLRNSLDFRPRRNDDTVRHDYSSFLKPTMSSLTEVDVTYYLNRIDKLYLTNRTQNIDGTNIKLKREKGIPAKSPIIPSRTPNPLVEMLIGTVFVPAFAASETTVVCVPENVTRKTMRDVNVLAQRLSVVEKRVKLHDLDIIALKSRVFNDNGEELLKSGMYIDDFSSTSRLGTGRSTIGIAIDTNNKLCMPAISIFNFRLTAENTQSISFLDNQAIMKYTEEEFASQQSVTISTTTQDQGQINVNPGGTNNSGRVTLTPAASMSIKLDPISAVKAFTEYDTLNKFIDWAENLTDFDLHNVVKEVVTTVDGTTADPIVVDGIPVNLDTVESTDVTTDNNNNSNTNGNNVLNNATSIVETVVVQELVAAAEGENIADVASAIVAATDTTSSAILTNTTGVENASIVQNTSSLVEGSQSGRLNNGESLSGELTVPSQGVSDNGVNSSVIGDIVDTSSAVVSDIANANDALINEFDTTIVAAAVSNFGSGDATVDSGTALVNGGATVAGYVEGTPGVEPTGTPRAELNFSDGTSIILYEADVVKVNTGSNPDQVIQDRIDSSIKSDGTVTNTNTGEIGNSSSSSPTSSVQDLLEISSIVPTSDEIADAADNGISTSNDSAVTVAMGGTVNDGLGGSDVTDPLARAVWEDAFSTGSELSAGSSIWSDFPMILS